MSNSSARPDGGPPQSRKNRIEKTGIPYMNHADFGRVALEIRANAKAKRATSFNPENWGLADEALRERELGARPSRRATV